MINEWTEATTPQLRLCAILAIERCPPLMVCDHIEEPMYKGDVRCINCWNEWAEGSEECVSLKNSIGDKKE